MDSMDAIQSRPLPPLPAAPAPAPHGTHTPNHNHNHTHHTTHISTSTTSTASSRALSELMADMSLDSITLPREPLFLDLVRLASARSPDMPSSTEGLSAEDTSAELTASDIVYDVSRPAPSHPRIPRT